MRSFVPLLAASVALAAPLTPIAPVLRRLTGVHLPVAGSAGKAYSKRADGQVNTPLLKILDQRLKNKVADNARNAQANRNRGGSNKLRRDSANEPLTDVFEQGVDELYYGPISMGTPSQTLQLDFDTGSADLWVPTELCVNCNGTEFHTLESSTYQQTVTPFEITYGSGAVVGTVAHDTVSVQSLTVDDQYFGAVDLESQNFVGQPFNGIFGFAFSEIAQTGQPTFVENLIAAGKLDQNLFAFYLARQQVEGSELSIGTTDSSKYTGDITYTPVTSRSYWEVQETGATVNGAAVAGTAFAAAVDTGTTLIYIPTTAAQAIFAAVPGASNDATDSAAAGADLYQYPCDSPPTIAFTYDGSDNQYTIDPADLNLGTSSEDPSLCVASIVGQDFQGVDGNNIAIVGDVFLKNWYSVYNYNGTADGAPAVGFAKAVQAS